MIDAAAKAEPISIAELAPPGGVLVIVPHPDDESLGCGLAIAAAHAAGRSIAIVQLTDGESSHPGSAAYPRERLVELRQREMAAAVAALVPGRQVDIVRVHLPDGSSRPHHITDDDHTRIDTLLQDVDAGCIWTTWAGDPHCDHETAAHLGDTLAQRHGLPLWNYIVWGRFGDRALPTLPLRNFTAPEQVGAKLKAVAAHRSQLTTLISDDPTAFTMPDVLTRHFVEHPEVFVAGKTWSGQTVL